MLRVGGRAEMASLEGVSSADKAFDVPPHLERGTILLLDRLSPACKFLPDGPGRKPMNLSTMLLSPISEIELAEEGFSLNIKVLEALLHFVERTPAPVRNSPSHPWRSVFATLKSCAVGTLTSLLSNPYAVGCLLKRGDVAIYGFPNLLFGLLNWIFQMAVCVLWPIWHSKKIRSKSKAS